MSKRQTRKSSKSQNHRWTRTQRVNSILALTGFGLLVAFNNCSQVDFAYDTEAARTKLNTAGGAITINGDAAYTKSDDVLLSIEHGSAEEMYITNVPGCESGGSWESFAPNKAWKLGQKNALAGVYVKFREAAASQIESDCVNDDIVHDDIPPKIQISKDLKGYINSASADVGFVLTDSGSGVTEGLCSLDQGTGQACKESHAMKSLAEGLHSVQIDATDRAGNTAQPAFVNFGVDLTPPALTINSGPAQVTGDQRGEFRFSAIDQLSGVARYECQAESSGAFETCVSPWTKQFGEGARGVRIRAVDVAGNVSAPVAYNWTIDLSAPIVRITKGPTPYSNLNTGLFEFEGTDQGQPITQFECSVDAGAYSACTSPFTSGVLTAGRHEFNVRGIDSVGNRSQPASYAWVIDLTPPTIEITQAPPAVTTRTQADLAFRANDTGSGIERVECRLDSAAFSTCDLAVTYMNLTEASHVFEVRATDRAGNVSPTVRRTWRVDLTKPVLTIVSGPQALTKMSEATLVMTADDPNGGKVARVECRLDNGAYETCALTKLYSGLAEGPRVFTARAIDEAGLMSDEKSWTWTVDRTGPAINFGQVPLTSIGQTDTANLQFTVTDLYAGVDRVECGLDAARAACSVSETRSFKLAPGQHSFTVLATDKLGNASQKVIEWTVQVTIEEKNQEIDVPQQTKLDVLVVIDNSGSMSVEQQSMATRFGSFIQKLSALDWQLGIVTTDISANAVKKDGRLLEFTGLSGTFMVTSAMPAANAQTAFGSTVQRPANEGSSNEQGIRAAYRAIERSQSTAAVDAPNRALFRAQAALAVLVVSDADETNPSGTLVSNTPQGLLDLVNTTWAGQKAFAFHSIIVKPNDQACLKLAGSGNEGYGLSYASLSGLTGGVIGSVCESDYSTQLATIGNSSAALVRSATLKCVPLDTNGDGKPDLRIETSNGSAPPGFVINGVNVTFDRALPSGKNRLLYSCLVK